MKSLNSTKTATPVAKNAVAKSTNEGLPTPTDHIYMWPTSRLYVSPEQTRDMEGVTEESVAELAASIKEHGVLEPLIIHSDGTLVAGHRRWVAAQVAKLTEVPVIIRDTLSSLEAYTLNAIENLHRAGYTPLEEANLYARMAADYKLSQEQVADRLHVPRLRVNRMIKLLKSSAYVQKLVNEKALSWSTAAEIAALTEAQQNFVAAAVVSQDLDRESTRQAVKLVPATAVYTEPVVAATYQSPTRAPLTFDEVSLIITTTMAKYAKTLRNQVAWIKVAEHSQADFYRKLFDNSVIEDGVFADAYLSILNGLQKAYADEVVKKPVITKTYVGNTAPVVGESMSDVPMDVPVALAQAEKADVYQQADVMIATMIDALKMIARCYSDDSAAKSDPRVSKLIDIALNALMSVNAV